MYSTPILTIVVCYLISSVIHSLALLIFKALDRNPDKAALKGFWIRKFLITVVAIPIYLVAYFVIALMSSYFFHDLSDFLLAWLTLTVTEWLVVAVSIGLMSSDHLLKRPTREVLLIVLASSAIFSLLMTIAIFNIGI